MKKIFSFLFISGFVIGLAVLAQIAQAATAGLTLSSASNIYTVGQTFDVQVVLSVDTQNVVDGIDLHYLHFTNPGATLEIVSQTPGTLCGDTLTNAFSNTEGWIDLSQVSGGDNYCASSGAVMTINFLAKAAGVSVLSFDAEQGNGTDTNVASEGLDILTSATGASFTVNAGAPINCAIKINNDAAATNSVNVFLNISGCSDIPSGMGQMKFSNTGVDGWSVAENYNESTPVSWTLSPDDAADKTVYAQFSDSLGIWTGNITDEIKLDTTAPSGTILINGTDSATKNTAVVLTLSASDTLSPPVSQMRFSNDNVDWTVAPVAYAVSASYNLIAGDGTKYVYVKFKDSLENWSSAFFDDIILDQTVPTITVPPSVSELTQTSAKVNWTTNEASSSQVEYGLDATYGSSTNIDANLVFSHSVSLSGLTANQTYHYCVKSKDDANNEQISADYTFLTSATPDATAPAAIVLQVANDPNNPETAVILTWTAPADDGADPISGSAASYDIRYSIAEIMADNFASATIAIGIPVPGAPGTAETFTVIGLSRQTKYYFAIKTSDEVPNVSLISNIAQTTTLSSGGGGGGGGGGGNPPSDTTAPAKPAEFKAVSSETQISFSWKNPKDTDFVRVKILRKNDKFSANSSDGQVIYEGNKESFIDKNLENKKIYYYAIFACDGVPNWSQSVTIKITASTGASANPEPAKPPVKEPDKIPLTDQKLEQPSTIKIEHKFKDKKPYVDLSWQNPASQEIKKINIWRSSILCQRDSLITTIDLTAKPLKQYSDQLPKDQEYFYILSSVNAAGQESKAVIQWSSQSGKIVGYLTKFTAVDRDCDGLQDERERLYKSDSQKADTDGDGYLDGLEIEIGFNPTVKAGPKIWDSGLSKRLKGKILLAPQFYGESYYVHPDNQKTYFLNRPADAFAIMRAHGLGITNANLAKIPKKDEEAEGDIKLRQRLAGKILLQVEEKGEAWYIYPDNLKRYYLGRPADAFAIMRSLSLGISNENLIKFDLQL